MDAAGNAMKLSPRELLLFAELWSLLRVPAGQAAKIMQTGVARSVRNRHKGKKQKRTRATARGR